jgi:hypothetical protein
MTDKLFGTTFISWSRCSFARPPNFGRTTTLKNTIKIFDSYYVVEWIYYIAYNPDILSFMSIYHHGRSLTEVTWSNLQECFVLRTEQLNYFINCFWRNSVSTTSIYF